jgi:hypothetical protein
MENNLKMTSSLCGYKLCFAKDHVSAHASHFQIGTARKEEIAREITLFSNQKSYFLSFPITLSTHSRNRKIPLRTSGQRSPKLPMSALKHTNVLIPIYNRHAESSFITQILRLLHLDSSSRSACPSSHTPSSDSGRTFRPILSSEHLIMHLSLATTLPRMLQISPTHRTGKS